MRGGERRRGGDRRVEARNDLERPRGEEIERRKHTEEVRRDMDRQEEARRDTEERR